jgi:hypothetical protein
LIISSVSVTRLLKLPDWLSFILILTQEIAFWRPLAAIEAFPLLERILACSELLALF